MLGFHIIRAGKVIICNECSRVLTSRQGAKEQPLAGQNMRAEAAEAGQETSSKEGWRMPYPPLTHQAAAARAGEEYFDMVFGVRTPCCVRQQPSLASLA